MGRHVHIAWAGLVLAVLLIGCASNPPGPAPSERPRRIALDHTLNTRDLGGYETRDGRRVRWGRLFRSDHLDDLDEDDIETLRAMGIRTFIDLRSHGERPDESVTIPVDSRSVWLPMLHPSMDPNLVMGRILRGDADEDYFFHMLQRANETFARDHGPEFARVIDILAAPDNLPALYHCTYGKDRTGFITAGILGLLGVPEETIDEDYLLSNYYLRNHIRRMARVIWLASAFRISRSDARDLLGVRLEYITTARRQMKDTYGSAEGFVKAFGVTDEMIEQMRENLLEPVPPQR